MVLYEQQLKTQDAVQKEHWKRAWESYRQQETGEHDSTEGVIKKLIENGMLSGQRVLDIGGGAGRYAIPFSKYAQDVTVTDISPRALAYARRYAEKKGCQNIPVTSNHLQDLKELSFHSVAKGTDLVQKRTCNCACSRLELSPLWGSQ